jgi:hypothetical protein
MIPEFPQFKSIELSDKEEIEKISKTRSQKTKENQVI